MDGNPTQFRGEFRILKPQRARSIDYLIVRVEMLARFAFNTKPPAGGHQQEDLATALTAFHKAFSDVDPSIEQGERQDQILAAAALMHYFATRSIPAMVVTTTACGGARKAALPVDLVTAAENALSLLAAIRRKRPNLGAVELEAPELEYELEFFESSGQCAGDVPRSIRSACRRGRSGSRRRCR